MDSPRVIVVTAGFSGKRSAIASALVDEYGAVVIPGKVYPESRKDRLLSWVGLGNICKNIKSVNDLVLRKAIDFDVIFIVKGNFITKDTLKVLKENSPSLMVVGWSSDDMYLPHNHSSIFKGAAGFYDFYYTSKSNNIDGKELESMGFRRVGFLHQGFDSGEHKYKKVPGSLFEDKVVFVGYGEEDRFNKMNFLAKNGVHVHVWGNGWTKWMRIRAHKNLHIYGYPLVGERYVEVLANSKISLCFLRKLNRDRHTARTFEIPACGGFMLAERTSEHLEYFSEDHEAVYFSDDHELLDKVRIYLKDDRMRSEISKNGYKRSIEDDYSYNRIARTIINEVWSNRFK